VFAAPGDAGNAVEVHTPAVDRLAAVSRKLRADVQTIRSNPFDSDYKEAVNFFASVRGLAGIIGLLAEQPGYRPSDAEGQAAKARLAPLKAKMDEITKQIESKVNLMNPLPVTAPQRVEARVTEAGRLAGMLHDADSVKDIKEVGDDASIPATWKAMFFEELGKSIHEAVVEVLKTKHESQIFDAAAKALDSHSKDTMIGACLWVSQGATVAAGNLPGPNSLYVGLVRVKALEALEETGTKGADAVLGDLLPHYFDALKFSPEEQTTFKVALEKFKEHHTTVQIEKDPNGIQVAKANAQKVYDEDLAGALKTKGSLQSGPGLTAVMTILNIICLVGVCKTTPDFADYNLRNKLDFTLAVANAGAGICATLLRMSIAKSVMTKIIANPAVGPALGYFAAAVNFYEGIDTLWVEAHKQKADGWMVLSGGCQIASGLVLAYGIIATVPGAQLVAVVLGIVASALALIADATDDKMVRFVSQLIKQIKEAKSTYDNTPLMNNLGLDALVNDLDKLVVSCDVTTLPFNKNWTGPGGLIVSKDVVHDRLNALGINSAEQRSDLVRPVWAE